jgi:hypothetical protein
MALGSTQPLTKMSTIARERLANTRFRDKPERPFARQRLGKHRLRAGIVEPDTELSVWQAMVHARFQVNAFMKSSSRSLGGGNLHSVLWQLEKAVHS